MTQIAEIVDRLRRLAKRREDEGIYTDAVICEEAAILLEHSIAAIGAGGQSYAQIVEPYAAAQRMIRDAIQELFGPIASLESEDATLLRGPEPHHEAEAQIDALMHVRDQIGAGGQAVAWRVSCPDDEIYGRGPDTVRFHPLSPDEIASGYTQQPLYTHPDDERVVEALREAESAFEEIRLILVHNLHEPERSAFWKAVSARNAIRAALEQESR